MTNRDAAHVEALGWLAAAEHARRQRATLTTAAYAQYGDQGSLIAGCERDHWPDHVKDAARAYARDISWCYDQAAAAWRRARKHATTFRRAVQHSRTVTHRY